MKRTARFKLILTGVEYARAIAEAPEQREASEGSITEVLGEERGNG